MTARRSLIEEYEETNEGRLEMAAARSANSVVALLNRALERSGMSQDDIAEIIGVGKSRVSQVLNGDGNYTVATIAKFLKAMDDDLVITLERPLPERAPRRQRTAPGRHDIPVSTQSSLKRVSTHAAHLVSSTGGVSEARPLYAEMTDEEAEKTESIFLIKESRSGSSFKQWVTIGESGGGRFRVVVS